MFEKIAVHIITLSTIVIFTSISSAEQLKLAIRYSDGNKFDFADFDNPRNPYRMLRELEPTSTKLPASRANTQFCAGKFDALIPIVGRFDLCDAELIQISQIEIVTIRKRGNLNNDLIGFMRGYDTKAARKSFPDARFVYVDHNVQLFRLIKERRIDLAFFEKENLEEIIVKRKVDSSDFEVGSFTNLPIFVAVQSGNTDVIRSLRNLISYQ